MNRKKNVSTAIVTVIAVVIVMAVLFALFTGKIPAIRTSDNFTPISQEDIGSLEDFRVGGYSPQGRVDSIVALWNKENTFFWTKGRYDVNPMTERDSIIYSVAVRVDIASPATSSQVMVEHEINRMLWGLLRTTLLGQNELTFPSYIQILAYLWIGDSPVPNSDFSYVFPSQSYAGILAETDVDKIIEYSGNPNEVIPTIPNNGRLWGLPPLIPNK